MPSDQDEVPAGAVIAAMELVKGLGDHEVSNTNSRVDRERCVVRQGRSEPGVDRAGAATERTLGRAAEDSRG